MGWVRREGTGLEGRGQKSEVRGRSLPRGTRGSEVGRQRAELATRNAWGRGMEIECVAQKEMRKFQMCYKIIIGNRNMPPKGLKGWHPKAKPPAQQGAGS